MIALLQYHVSFKPCQVQHSKFTVTNCQHLLWVTLRLSFIRASTSLSIYKHYAYMMNQWEANKIVLFEDIRLFQQRTIFSIYKKSWMGSLWFYTRKSFDWPPLFSGHLTTKVFGIVHIARKIEPSKYGTLDVCKRNWNSCNLKMGAQQIINAFVILCRYQWGVI